MTDDEAWEKAKRHEIWASRKPRMEALRAKVERGEIDFRAYNTARTNVALDCLFETLPFRTYLP